MVFNVFIFVWVIVVLIRHTRNTAALRKEDITIQSVLRRIFSISGIMTLFGLTWLFAVFTFLPINELKKTFVTCFVIFNSFQGLFIFFFYVVLKEEIRESWRELLSCGRYQSKLLPDSQPRVALKLHNPSNSNNSALPKGVKSTTELLKSDLDTMTNEAAKSESKTPPPSKPPSDESVLNQDYDALELDNFSTKTAISIEATVTEGEVNEEKEKEKTTSSDKSKTEDKDIKFNSRMCIKRYSTRRQFKHHVEQVEVDFYDDDSDKEDGITQM